MCKVMIVDDNEANIRLFKFMLSSLKCETTFVSDAAKVLHEVHLKRPDVILLDMMLNGNYNGLTLTHEIRQDPDLQHVKIIAVTAAGDMYNAAAALDAGCDLFLRKPVSPARLRDAVLEMLNIAPN